MKNLSAAICCFLALALMVLAMKPAKRAQAAVPEPLLNVHRVVILGDSITQFGGGRGGYVWLIQHYLDALYPDQHIQVINAGISGHKSNDMLARFDRDVVQKQPELVTISVGINDVWHGFDKDHPTGGGPAGVSLDDFKKNVGAMLDLAQKANARVILFTPTIFEDGADSPRNTVLKGYTEAMRQMGRDRNLVVADQNAAFWNAEDAWNAGRKVKLTVDGVHMAPAGNALMARTALLAMGVTADELARVDAEALDRLTLQAPKP